mgnify:CR=1 FL=1
MKKIFFTIITLSLIMMYSCNEADTQGKDNPFFSEFDTPDGVPPFDQIKIEHYLPAFEAGMKEHTAEVDAIIKNADAPTFENTIVALDKAGKMLNRVSSVFFALNSANTDSVRQDIAKQINPKLTEHGDNINLNEQLFAKIKAINDDPASENLTTEQKKLLEKYYKSFVRSGILLSGDKQNRLREINKELGMATLNFGQNLLAETKNFQLVIEKEEDLSGLPADVVASAAQAAKDRELDGKWVFTLSKPSWEPFLQYADNRDLREKLYKAMYSRGNNGNDNDNKEIIKQIVSLRLEKANLLGYATHADYVLEETMAKKPENVMKLLNEIWEYALPQAKREAAELTTLAKKETGNDFKLESWDWFYYVEKLRKEKYALNEDELKQYFTYENVREGVFNVANKLYGISFKERTDIPVYQKDVQAFEVSAADGKYIGIIYMDYYAREGQKKNGAWMGSFRKQSANDSTFTHPLIYNVGNFASPTADTPSLLTIDQVGTVFHEFGHGLHGLLSNCTYNTLSGTSVARDFVELPSQVMEHWAFEPEVLKSFAKSYKTGEVISDELIEKIQKASTFNQGFMTTELVAAAILDMNWHTIGGTNNVDFNSLEGIKELDIDKFEADAMNKIGLISEIIPRYRSTYFSHIFDGGYSSGYYSYLWSEVLDSDAYQAFVETGNIFDPKTAQAFRDNVLSKGGSDDPMTLYKKFRGAEPNPVYLLKNRGFVK